MSEETTYIEGVLLSEDALCSLADLCRFCSVPVELVQAMIDEGILSPQGASPGEWRFATCLAIRRVRTAVRLQRDLRVNLPGCGLVLDLLDELEELRGLSPRL